MAGAHIFFAFMQLVICDHAPAQRNVEDSDFVSAVPHSNQHTVGTASWQNHDSSPLAVCYYTALSCLSRSIKPLHFLHIVEATQHIYQAIDIPVLLRGWVEAVVTNDWCNIYSL